MKQRACNWLLGQGPMSEVCQARYYREDQKFQWAVGALPRGLCAQVSLRAMSAQGGSHSPWQHHLLHLANVLLQLLPGLPQVLTPLS